MLAEDFLKLRELAKLIQALGLEDDPRAMSYLNGLSIRWNNYLYQEAIDYCRTKSSLPLLETKFPIPTKKDDLEAVDGPIKMGVIDKTDIKYGLTPLQLQMHGVIAGASGFGKSTLVKIMCRTLIEQGNIIVWVIDPKEGGDYRFLAHDNVLILRPDVMRFNPFNVIPNVPVEMLREIVTEVTADSFAVYDASESVISEHVKRVFDKHEQPNFYDFMESVQSEKPKYGGRRAGYLDTINSRVKKIDSSMRDIFNCSTDKFSEQFDKNVVFEIGSLSGSAQRVLVPWIIMKLVLYKTRNPTKELSHVLVFDEAQAQIFSRNMEIRGRQSFMATLATQARAYGLGILVLSQQPHMKLMREITANSCIKVAFHLGDGEEVLGFGRSMGLNYEQMDELHHFKRGEAICRVGLGYTEPVKLQVFNYESETISDSELTEIMRPKWDRLLEGIKPARPDSPPETVPVRSTQKPETVAKKPLESTEDLSGLSPDEKAYLRIVQTHPFRLYTEVYDLLGDEKVMGTETISQSRAVKIRKGLETKGYLESHKATGIGKSGRPKFNIVTEKANMGKVRKPRGGWLHAFHCYRVSEYFKEQGAKVSMGDNTSGNECDLVVILDGKSIGVEVVVSGIVAENIPTHLKAFGELLILCIDDKKQREMIKLAGEMEKVKIGLLKDYFDS